MHNELDVLLRFQDRSCIRQFIEEVQEPAALVLEHLDDNLLNVSNTRRLGKPVIKSVAKRVLEALNILHEAGYVHTGTMHNPLSR